MQKKLIAAAVAGLASAGAFAQMNVTVYGQIDLSVSNEWGTTTQQLKNSSGTTTTAASQMSGVGNLLATGATNSIISGQAGSRTTMRSGLYRGSYVGFKGTEDLGGGMKMDFVVETNVEADGNPGAGTGQAAPTAGTNNGRGLFGDAESSLALTTGVGRFKFGRQPNNLATLMAAADPYFGKGPGGVEQLIIQPLATTTANNAIRYDIAASGFFGGYQFNMSENQDKVAAATYGSVSVLWAGYKDSSLLVLAGQGIVRNVNASTTNSALAGLAALGIPVENNGRTATYNVLAGTYDFQVAKLHAMYLTGRTTQNTTDAALAVPVTSIDTRTWMLGATVPMGAHAFKISYVNTDDKRPFDMDGNSWGLGYEYDFSKRTKFYSRLAAVKNSNGAAFGVIGGGGQLVAGSYLAGASVATPVPAAAYTGNAAAQGNRTNGLTLGMQHSF